MNRRKQIFKLIILYRHININSHQSTNKMGQVREVVGARINSFVILLIHLFIPLVYYICIISMAIILIIFAV